MLDDMRHALWAMVSETGTTRALALAIKARRGWRLSDHAAVSRVSQWLSPSDDHEYPASEIVTAIRVTGRDYVSPILLREAMRTEIEREAQAPAARAPMSRVRHEQTQQRRRA